MKQNDKRKRLISKIVIQVFLPIIAGIVIYINWRAFLPSFTFNFLQCDDKIPEWIKYNLPDGLWLFALLSSISIIWQYDLSSAYNIWLITAIATSILSELAQKFKLISGTFDIYDVLAYLTAVIFFLLTNNTNRINQVTHKT